MSLTAAAIRLMASRGMTAQDIADIAEAMEAPMPELSMGAIRTRQWRARLEATGLTAEEWRVTSMRVIARDGGVCQYCGTTKGRMACDHVTPLSQGGSSDDGNLVCACHGCNGGKSGNTLEQWLGEAKAAEWRYHRETSRDITSLPKTKVSPTPPSKTQTIPTPSPPKGGSVPTKFAFDKFWLAYPRKVGKADARKAFDRAWRKLPPFEEEAILCGALERAKSAWTDPQFIPHAATWLNGERWTDEPEIPRKTELSGFAKWQIATGRA